MNIAAIKRRVAQKCKEALSIGFIPDEGWMTEVRQTTPSLLTLIVTAPAGSVRYFVQVKISQRGRKIRSVHVGKSRT